MEGSAQRNFAHFSKTVFRNQSSQILTALFCVQGTQEKALFGRQVSLFDGLACGKTSLSAAFSVAGGVRTRILCLPFFTWLEHLVKTGYYSWVVRVAPGAWWGCRKWDKSSWGRPRKFQMPFMIYHVKALFIWCFRNRTQSTRLQQVLRYLQVLSWHKSLEKIELLQQLFSALVKQQLRKTPKSELMIVWPFFVKVSLNILKFLVSILA